MYKEIPIKAAKKLADKFDKNQVIIITWDKEHGRTHVTTYGKTEQECFEAAQGGEVIKQALGWPEEDRNAVPEKL